MKIDLKIPNLGEAEDTEIIEVSVSKGAKIKKNDPLIVLESEKAAMEVPADYDGEVIEVLVKEGESVAEGKIFAILEIKEEDSKEGSKKHAEEKIEDKPTEVINTSNQEKEKVIENLKDFEGVNNAFWRVFLKILPLRNSKKSVEKTLKQ